MALLDVILVLAAVLLVLAFVQQLALWRKKRSLPGPAFVPPFLGNIHAMLMQPFKFYEDQEKYGPLSWNSVMGWFILFSKNTELTRKVFKASESFNLWLTGGAKYILGENNIAFMSGEPHKELRRRLLPLFTPRALSIYIPIQERVIRKHMDAWLSLKTEMISRHYVRDLNMETSQEIFIGPYVNAEKRKQFAEFYWAMNEGFLSFPIPIPGNTLWRAMKAREKVIELISGCVEHSRKRMSAGETPACLLDIWMENEIQEFRGAPLPEREIALHMLDFLFASQDASTSSLVWVLTLLDEHRDVLERLRAEQKELRPNNEPVTLELLERMEYTRQVVREVLRFRPPATMVPHVALKDTQLTEDYVVPKGSVVLPSIWCAHFQGYENPQKFDPERFNAARREHETCAKNWLVFGYGPHLCIGRTYAMNHLMLFTALLVSTIEWERRKTPSGDNIVFLPTIFPEDGCIVTMKPRKA